MTGDPSTCTCWMAQTTHVGALGPCPVHRPLLDAAGEPVSPYAIVDLTDATPEKMATEIERARLTPRTVLVVAGDESVRLVNSIRALDEARPYGGADAIRDMLNAIPTPAIAEARPMNRKQRRLAARGKK